MASAGQRLRSAAFSSFGLMVVCVVAMGLVELVDVVFLSDRLQRNGIGPRRLGGLAGIVFAPWLHASLGHYLSNAVAFLALGWLVALRGFRYWVIVSLSAWFVGGAMVWAVGGGTNHLGASGVVFGFFGALLGATIKDRRPTSLAPALVALLFYATMLVGILPQPGISWEGHLFGMLSGLVVALLMVPPRQRTDLDEDEPLYEWELDEPWLAD